jgi:predicted alternative tryptophan synthase beta-subunit
VSRQVGIFSTGSLHGRFSSMSEGISRATHSSSRLVGRSQNACLAPDLTSSGSIGIVASEMLELAATDPMRTLGRSSLLKSPILHHTVIGLSA